MPNHLISYVICKYSTCNQKKTDGQPVHEIRNYNEIIIKQSKQIDKRKNFD